MVPVLSVPSLSVSAVSALPIVTSPVVPLAVSALKTLRFRSSLEKVPPSMASYVTEVPLPLDATAFKVIVPLVVV